MDKSKRLCEKQVKRPVGMAWGKRRFEHVRDIPARIARENGDNTVDRSSKSRARKRKEELYEV